MLQDKIFWWLLVYHVVLACLNNGFFQPDEYWQSLEIAHRVVFGYGYLTWEWQTSSTSANSWTRLFQQEKWWEQLSTGPIRSVIHPLIFTPLYMVLKWLDLDGNFYLMTILPKFVQAVFSTFGAYYTSRLATLLHADEKDTSLAHNTLKSMLSSPYYLYTATRTFSNTTEASLSSVALYYWFRSQHFHTARLTSQIKALSLAALACLLRPTNAVLWIFLIPLGLVRSKNSKRAIQIVILSSIISSIAIILSATIDTAFNNGRPTLPLIPFLLQNVYHSLSLFYGSHPWHWYLSQGLPVILMASLPLTIMGANKLSKNTLGKDILYLTAWTIGIYSLLGHKEWRFLQPVIPLLHICAGAAWSSSTAKKNALSKSPNHTQKKKLGESSNDAKKNTLASAVRDTSKGIIRNTSFVLAFYLIAWHCIGQSFELPLYLRELAKENTLQSVGFLMPCHSTPWQSHFHLGTEIDMWFLTCEPPRDGQDVAAYKDESDYFYLDPVKYLQRMLPSNSRAAVSVGDSQWKPKHAAMMESDQRTFADDHLHTWPSHLVHFDALLDHPEYGQDVKRFLEKRGYRPVKSIWNSLFHDDPRRRGRIAVWEKQNLVP